MYDSAAITFHFAGSLYASREDKPVSCKLPNLTVLREMAINDLPRCRL